MIGHGKEMRMQATAWAHKSTNLHNTMKVHAQRSWRVEVGERRKVHLLFSRARTHARRLESSDGLLLLLLLRVSAIARLLLRGRRPSEATTVVATLLRRGSGAAVACGRHLARRRRSRREASRRMSVRRSRRRRQCRLSDRDTLCAIVVSNWVIHGKRA